MIEHCRSPDSFRSDDVALLQERISRRRNLPRCVDGGLRFANPPYVLNGFVHVRRLARHDGIDAASAGSEHARMLERYR